jgi:hypothetical protein
MERHQVLVEQEELIAYFLSQDMDHTENKKMGGHTTAW